MANRLANENSPYLLQHAHNPVEWYPWGREALEKARNENKVIFLSIGYAACHWCHVMAHESFEDPATAAVMNEYFINIKVDREERPDLDGIYMGAVVAMTGQGGWPMSVFLTPEGEPFFGGTYFPPVRRHNMPAFREVLSSVQRAWTNDHQEIIASGRKITDYLKTSSMITSETETLHPGFPEEAAFNLAQSYDWKTGGWGNAPKFPQPMAIEFLLRRAARGDKLARDIAVHVLKSMAQGGMYDLIGGGFARYSTDTHWLVPHFEKMLYDNAQLARVYLFAYLLTGNPTFRRVTEATLDFMQREMLHPAGGFYSSLDADSEGEEGKYYVWSTQEIQALLSDETDFELCRQAYHLTANGNFEGRHILQQTRSDEELGEQFHLSPGEIRARLQRINQTLLDARQHRVRPGTDDKVLTSWNALALLAFAEAARYLKRSDYLAVAIRNAAFVKDQLFKDQRLLRSWREGVARQDAFLEDHAALILALLALYQSTFDNSWFQFAYRLTTQMVEAFPDPQGGFFDTRHDTEAVLVRPKDIQDNATPCGSSLATRALQHMSAFTGNTTWSDTADAMLASIQAAARRYPTAFANWLCAADFAFSDVLEIAVVGESSQTQTQDLLASIWKQFRPNVVVAAGKQPIDPEAPPFLFDRLMLDGQPAAYVCRNFICKLPVTSPAKLIELLEQKP
jgi:uncharacterized protein YyaL (SSP411 family)